MTTLTDLKAAFQTMLEQCEPIHTELKSALVHTLKLIESAETRPFTSTGKRTEDRTALTHAINTTIACLTPLQESKATRITLSSKAINTLLLGAKIQLMIQSNQGLVAQLKPVFDLQARVSFLEADLANLSNTATAAAPSPAPEAHASELFINTLKVIVGETETNEIGPGWVDVTQENYEDYTLDIEPFLNLDMEELTPRLKARIAPKNPDARMLENLIRGLSLIQATEQAQEKNPNSDILPLVRWVESLHDQLNATTEITDGLRELIQTFIFEPLELTPLSVKAAIRPHVQYVYFERSHDLLDSEHTNLRKQLENMSKTRGELTTKANVLTWQIRAKQREIAAPTATSEPVAPTTSSGKGFFATAIDVASSTLQAFNDAFDPEHAKTDHAHTPAFGNTGGHIE